MSCLIGAGLPLAAGVLELGVAAGVHEAGVAA